MPLVNSHYLYLYNQLGLKRKKPDPATLEYRYWYQATADENSWIFRYEYLRDPPSGYPYAQCHLHVNARAGTYKGVKPFHDLHLPVGDRVTIEFLVRHLISEHGVSPISSNWKPIVERAEEEFREIQRRRLQR